MKTSRFVLTQQDLSFLNKSAIKATVVLDSVEGVIHFCTPKNGCAILSVDGVVVPKTELGIFTISKQLLSILIPGYYTLIMQPDKGIVRLAVYPSQDGEVPLGLYETPMTMSPNDLGTYLELAKHEHLPSNLGEVIGLYSIATATGVQSNHSISFKGGKCFFINPVVRGELTTNISDRNSFSLSRNDMWFFAMFPRGSTFYSNKQFCSLQYMYSNKRFTNILQKQVQSDSTSMDVLDDMVPLYNKPIDCVNLYKLIQHAKPDNKDAFIHFSRDGMLSMEMGNKNRVVIPAQKSPIAFEIKMTTLRGVISKIKTNATLLIYSNGVFEINTKTLRIVGGARLVLK